MTNWLLAIDDDIEHFYRQEKVWNNHGIMLNRTSTMDEAIQKIKHEQKEIDKYLLIGINAGSVDYMAKLSILQELILAPIHIMTAKYSLTEHEAVFSAGAYYYGEWWRNIEEGPSRALVLIRKYHDLLRQNTEPNILLVDEKMHISLSRRKLYIDSNEIALQPKEYGIIVYLARNRGRIVTYEELIKNVWGKDFMDESHSLTWSQMRNLKKQIGSVADFDSYIKNIKNVGYQLI